MKKVLAIFVMLACIVSANPFMASAVESTLTEEQKSQNEVKANMIKNRVFDMAYLYTEAEEETLNEVLLTFSSHAKMDIMVVTTEDMDGKTDQVYLEDFQDELYFTEGTLAENAALMLINMEDRYVKIQGYGDCEFWLNNDRIEYILDWVYEELVDGDYYGAAETFGTQVVYYMNQDQGVSTEYEDGQDYGEAHKGKTNYYTETLREKYSAWEYVSYRLEGKVGKTLLVAIGGSLIACICILSSKRTKVTINQTTYADMGNSGITASRDDYLRTTVTKIRRPKESSGTSSSGGVRSSGGGGRSSGGRSHSGGSRRF